MSGCLGLEPKSMPSTLGAPATAGAFLLLQYGLGGDDSDDEADQEHEHLIHLSGPGLEGLVCV